MSSSSNTKVNLRLDWCSYKAAKYACEHWHYSGCVPAGKLVKVGVWEDGKFIGVVIFGRGAAQSIGHRYKLSQDECVELVRVALGKHKSYVSKVLAVALRFLISQSPGLKLVVSFADAGENHHGGIYQASNWAYVGYGALNERIRKYEKNGIKYSWRHVAGVLSKSGKPSTVEGAKSLGFIPQPLAPKHKYLYPLTPEMRAKIEPLRKPYPKRASNKGNHPDQGQGGGAVPT